MSYYSNIAKASLHLSEYGNLTGMIAKLYYNWFHNVLVLLNGLLFRMTPSLHDPQEGFTLFHVFIFPPHSPLSEQPTETLGIIIIIIRVPQVRLICTNHIGGLHTGTGFWGLPITVIVLIQYSSNGASTWVVDFSAGNNSSPPKRASVLVIHYYYLGVRGGDKARVWVKIENEGNEEEITGWIWGGGWGGY